MSNIQIFNYIQDIASTEQIEQVLSRLISTDVSFILILAWDYDLLDVQAHTFGGTEQVEVYFSPGIEDPKLVLAHELVHVAQLVEARDTSEDEAYNSEVEVRQWLLE